MKLLYDRVKSKLYTDTEGNHEDDIARIFLYTGIVLAGLALITGFFNDVSFIMNLPNLLMMIICYVLAVVVKKDTFKNSLYGLYFVAFIYFPFIYFTNGGIYGAGIFYFVMIMVYFSFYKKGQDLYFFLVLLIIYYISLIAFSFSYPEYVIPYPDDMSMFIDIAINFTAVTLIMTLVTSVIYRSYEAEKKRVNDILEKLKEQNLVLEDYSNRDSLTKVFNRQFFRKKISDLLFEYKEFEKSFYLLMIDIDYFKRINDTYGHIVGDRVLIRIAEILNQSVRSDDMVVRYGGEEFIVIIRNAEKHDGREIAERIRKNVETAIFENEIKVTVSIGVSKSSFGDDENDIVERSDKEMYKVKRSGRNGVSVNY